MDGLKRQLSVKRTLGQFIALFLSFVIMGQPVYADVTAADIKNAIPASTRPEVISNTLSQQPTTSPTALQPVGLPKQPETSLGPQAEKIKFKLVKIILEGNHVYSDAVLEKLYQDKLNTEITVAQLQDIVQSITNYYRNNGYILTRAILPPQHIQNGIVHVRVVEGYINHVNVIGRPKGAKGIIQAYGDKIAESKPLQIKVMEHYLRLANEVPGMQVRAVLEPSKTEIGASDLDLAANEQRVTAYYSYDDYGTLYLGPLQNTVNVALNSMLRSGDTSRLTYVQTTRPLQLKFYDASYTTPFGSNGLTFSLGKNNSTTRPGLNLASIDTLGSATTVYGLFEYPILRSRTENFTLDGGFNYIDSQVTTFSLPLYTDHLRTLKFGGNYDFSDRLNGSNLLGLHAEQGFSVLDASSNPSSTTTSRFGADGIFTKFVAQVVRVQPIFQTRCSLFFMANGQYSFEPLLSSEQFGFGGSQQGRGYDPAEIIGDRGAGGTLEFRVDNAPGWLLLNSFQLYYFYDQGIIWNLRHIANIPTEESAASTGFGSRFVFTKNITGNVMLSQPLTRPIAAEALVGNGTRPRIQFSAVASL